MDTYLTKAQSAEFCSLRAVLRLQSAGGTKILRNYQHHLGLREKEWKLGRGRHWRGKGATNVANVEQKGRKRASGIVNCGVLSAGNKFRSNSTGEEFNIRQNINCNSTNIIYLVTCKRCGMQGVGKATKFNKRISNYITQIKKKIEACCTNKHFFQTEEHS